MLKDEYVIRLNPEREQLWKPWKALWIIGLAWFVKKVHLAAAVCLLIEASYFMGEHGRVRRDHLIDKGFDQC